MDNTVPQQNPNHSTNVPDPKHHGMGYGTISSYTLGFVISLVLTLAAYFIIDRDWLTGNKAVFAVVALGFAQAIFQFIYFLNLGRETKPRYNLLVFSFMVGVLAILVWGSIWIMNNLNYNMMPDQ